MNRRLTALALALACLAGVLYLTGCAQTLDRYPDQPPVISPVNTAIESVPVSIMWHWSVDAVNDACPTQQRAGTWITYGCARLELAPLRCTINALVPKDFNDVPALAVLGHELTHCFLAMH